MGDLQVGDRVAALDRVTGHNVYGTVLSITPALGKHPAQAVVMMEENPTHTGRWAIRVSKLTRVDTPVVPASSLEALCDDYWAMRWAGDLGGTEAEALKK